jgi:hypothetical protein
VRVVASRGLFDASLEVRVVPEGARSLNAMPIESRLEHVVCAFSNESLGPEER